jgi:hypothetical protein
MVVTSALAVVQTHLLETLSRRSTASRFARTPLTVFTTHHSHEPPLQRKVRLLAADALCARRLADLVIAPSDDVKQTWTGVHRLPTERITIIRHGIARNRVKPSSDETAKVSALGTDATTIWY